MKILVDEKANNGGFYVRPIPNLHHNPYRLCRADTRHGVLENRRNIIMKLLLPILCCALLYWLATTSHHRDGEYSQSDIDAVTRLSLQPVALKQRQAAAIRDLWGIKEAEVAQPVVLWK